jgi:threonine/homoserine/homoserine lactone efflux protein
MFQASQRTQAMHEFMIADFSHLWLFFLLVAGIIILPGMDMAYVMASSLTGGRRSGMAAVSGVVAGGAVHVVMGVLGIGILLETFPGAFNAMLLAGAAYIAWIGWQLISGASPLREVSAGRSVSLATNFRRGAVSCLLNPKAYLFMLAIFPQFLRSEHGSILMQAVAMGLIICLTQLCVYGAIALGASGLRVWLRGNPQAQIRLGQTIGTLLILTGLWTAWQSWS